METFQLAGSGPVYYEKHLVPLLFEPLAARLVALVDPTPDETGLDVACGTGAVARQLVGAGVRMTGVDLNPDMLSLASSLEPGVTWIEGDGQALALPPASFDLATCQQGLQFMPDPGAALRSMHGVLRPGGRLAAAVWRPLRTCPGFNALTNALDARVGTAAGDVMRGPFALGDCEPVRDLVSRAGFAAVRIHNHCQPVRYASIEELVRSEIASTPLAGMAESWPADTIPNLIADVTTALSDYVADDGVLFPICAYLVTATVSDG